MDCRWDRLGQRLRWAAPLLLLLAGSACRPPVPEPAWPRERPPAAAPSAAPRRARLLGYAIQAGAFARVENAARLSEGLQRRGVDATYFAGAGGLFRVRFGDYPTREAARAAAEELRRQGVIDAFWIVAPQELPAQRPQGTEAGLRAALVETARSFSGVPYLWGGASAETGFDCSGLTRAVYRLNGLALPRTAREQWAAGSPASRRELRPGDLVFFATGRGDRVTHVGLYVGRDRFIHAPQSGRAICEESLEQPYFRTRYLGARSFLG